jgi:CRISPR-associated endonuclease/helicase Cas3
LALDFSVLRAHTNSPDGRVDSLAAHSSRVAELARGFAVPLGCGEIGALLGMLHDVGKALPGFQRYLDDLDSGKTPPHGPPHAIWGAAFWFCVAQQRLWREICIPVAGHHAGLASSADLGLRLAEFSKQNEEELDRLRLAISGQGILKGKVLASKMEGTRLEMRIRFLLSCLGDADFIATEEHFNPHKAGLRGQWPRLSDLWPLFEEKQKRLLERAKESWNEVQRVRAEVYQDCLKAAELPPGIFRLTVPTGGGKTLSSLGFALRHALLHGLRRIVLAVPYTSITEQSAKVYRDYLGGDAVLEHHSNLEIPEDGEDQDASHVRARLATENWDPSVIVTTTVQLFESLFARRPGKVRKLHNLAGSVILLDEVQTLPLELLRSTLDGLRALVVDAGATVVLCTATQPTFDDSPYLNELTDLPVREIVGRSCDHFSALRRVRYERWTEPISWQDVASKMASQTQVLVILNTRRDALSLLDALKGRQGLLHLSTLLCGAHQGMFWQRLRADCPPASL